MPGTGLRRAFGQRRHCGARFVLVLFRVARFVPGVAARFAAAFRGAALRFAAGFAGVARFAAAAGFDARLRRGFARVGSTRLLREVPGIIGRT